MRCNSQGGEHHISMSRVIWIGGENIHHNAFSMKR